MPVICEFYGIKILLYWEDHSPPHFHARYGEFEIYVDIAKGVVIRGFFPVKQLKLVLAWCELHREELMEDWSRAQSSEQLLPIEPLK